MHAQFGPIRTIDLKTPSRPPAYAFVEFDDPRCVPEPFPTCITYFASCLCAPPFVHVPQRRPEHRRRAEFVVAMQGC